MPLAPKARFLPLTSSTVPDSSRPILEKMMKTSGVIPNLMVMFANGPTALEGYHVQGSVWEDGSFPPANDNSSFLLQALKTNAATLSRRIRSGLHLRPSATTAITFRRYLSTRCS